MRPCRSNGIFFFNFKQLKQILDIGAHSISVINDIIEYGQSKEVEEIKNEDKFNSIQVPNRC